MRRRSSRAAGMLVVAIMVAACSDGGNSDGGNSDGGTSAADGAGAEGPEAAGLPPLVPGELVAQLHRPAQNLRSAGGYLYATGVPYTLIRSDPETGDVVELPFGREFGDVADGGFAMNTVVDGQVAMVVFEGGPDDDRLLVPDTATGELTSIDIPADEFLTFPPSLDESGVVVGLETGRAARVADDVADLGAFVEIPGVSRLTDPVRHGTSVWLAAPDDSAVVELDASDLSLRRRVDVAPLATTLAIDDDTLWVGHAAGPSLTRIDLASGEVVDEVDLAPDDPRARPSEVDPVVVPVDGRLFARVAYLRDGQSVATIVEVDPAAGEVAARRTVASGIATLLAVDGELLSLDSEGRILAVDLVRFAESGAGAPVPSPAVFPPTDAERAVLAAFASVYDPDADPATAAGHVDTGASDRSTDVVTVLERGRATLADAGIASFATVAATVDGDRAWVSFDALDSSGRRIVSDDVAALVEVDGAWRVPLAQVCLDIAALGGRCP